MRSENRVLENAMPVNKLGRTNEKPSTKKQLAQRKPHFAEGILL